MTLQQKKEHILRCVRLGMELFQAELVAECTTKEIETIDKDKKFLERVNQYYAIEEYDLLVKHNNAMALAAVTGKTGAIQWKLERINPGRWGKEEEGVLKNIPNLTVSLVGVTSEKKEDGISS